MKEAGANLDTIIYDIWYLGPTAQPTVVNGLGFRNKTNSKHVCNVIILVVMIASWVSKIQGVYS